MKFVSLESALNVDWTQESYKKRIKRMDPSYFLLQVIQIGNFLVNYLETPLANSILRCNLVVFIEYFIVIYFGRFYSSFNLGKDVLRGLGTEKMI